jgi:Na+-driven multidrug efflux pump
MSIGAVVFNAFPEKLLLLFNATSEMLYIGVPALRIISLHYVFAGFCVVFLSVFQALGNGMESLFIAVSRQLLLLLPIAWLLSLIGSVNFIWWAFPVTELGTLLLCFFFMRRVYNGKLRDLR